MLYKLMRRDTGEECGFSTKQIEFLKKSISNLEDFEVKNMTEEKNPEDKAEDKPAEEGTKSEEEKEKKEGTGGNQAEGTELKPEDKAENQPSEEGAKPESEGESPAA